MVSRWLLKAGIVLNILSYSEAVRSEPPLPPHFPTADGLLKDFDIQFPVVISNEPAGTSRRSSARVSLETLPISYCKKISNCTLAKKFRMELDGEIDIGFEYFREDGSLIYSESEDGIRCQYKNQALNMIIGQAYILKELCSDGTELSANLKLSELSKGISELTELILDDDGTPLTMKTAIDENGNVRGMALEYLYNLNPIIGSSY